MTSHPKRNLQLDVLRGVAILLVIGRHLDLPRPGGVMGTLAELWFRIGWLGVELFFVLSGFLIGGLLLTELERHGTIDVPRFLIRRGLKIYPLYLMFIAYLLLMPVAKAFVADGDGWGAFEQHWAELWPNLLFLHNYIGSNPAGHTWTLAVEEHFYLMLPFGLVALGGLGQVQLLGAVCLVFVPALLVLRCLSVWTGDPFAERMAATHLRMDALLFGVAIRALAHHWPVRFMALRRWRGVLVVSGLFLWLPNVFDPSATFVRTVGLTTTLLGSGAFLAAAYHTHSGDWGRLVPVASHAASLVAWIGVYSYGIYLWHVTAIGILGREFGGRVVALAGGATQVGWVVSALAVGTGAIVAGVAASKMVEWPVLRLRDRIFPSRTGSFPLVTEKVRAELKSSPRVPASSA